MFGPHRLPAVSPAGTASLKKTNNVKELRNFSETLKFVED